MWEEKLYLHKTRSAELVESILEIIKKNLENGEDVLISGFWGKYGGRFLKGDWYG
jgi:nucleoid DNA-binding protein